MPLTTLTFTPGSIDAVVKRYGPPGQRRMTITLTGNESFTEAALSEPDGTSKWCRFPATMDHDTPATLTFDLRGLYQKPGGFSTMIRASKSGVTADLPVKITVHETGVPRRRRRA